MRCANCHFEASGSMRYCTQCGTALPVPCPECRFDNPADAKFCGGCGVRLQAVVGVVTPSAPAVPKAATSGDRKKPADRNPPLIQAAGVREMQPKTTRTAAMERRHLTVMFCDLVDSSVLSSNLDPEDLHHVVCAYHDMCATIIRSYEGYIAQYLGDGILVYFSYPLAHEDDAQRAIRTALGIVRELQKLTRQLESEIPSMAGRTLQVRVGIHTGYVVVGDVGQVEKVEPIAMGEAPNVAARLQVLAEPGAVLITAATRQLVEGYFACRSLGTKSLKGFAQSQDVYQIISESGIWSRFENSVTAGLTPMVGRDEQIELLLKSWDYARDGMGQVVLLRGEPGIGKSRLVQTFKERTAGAKVLRIDCNCFPYFQHTAFYPVIELLQRAFRFESEDSLEDKNRKVRETLAPLETSLPQLPGLMAVLMSLRSPQDEPAAANLSPQQLKERTISAMLNWILARSQDKPLLIVFEDLQWADPSTLDFLSRLVDQVATSRILLILTFRSDFAVPWEARSHIVPITVNRLAPSNAVALVRKLTKGKALPVEVLDQIVRKTDGVPLFIEELTKMVLGSGWLREEERHYQLAGPLPPLAIPTTLQDSLMARLDRLEAVKEVAQLGAALGREFSYDLLQAVTRLDAVTLQRALAKLVEAEVLYPHGVEPYTTFRFKHALIQDAAYQSLLRVKRQQYHQQIAGVLELQFPQLREGQPELLAHHCTEAGMFDQAVSYWQQAGVHAIARSANHEGIAHLERGLQILPQLVMTPEREQQELSMWLALGLGYMATKGVAAPEVGDAFQKARRLAQRSNDITHLVRVLRGMSRYYLVRGEFENSLEYGEQLLQIANDTQDPGLLAGANYVVGCAFFFSGKLVDANQRLEAGLKLHSEHAICQGIALYEPFDTHVACHAFGALPLWYLGYPDQALARSRRSLQLAEELGQPYSIVGARNLAAWLHMLRGEYQTAVELTEAQLPMCDEMGFSLYIALGTMLRGWALAKLGRSPDGVTDVRQGMIAYRATGAGMNLPFILGVIAEDLGQRGHTAEALTLIREAIESMERSNERLNEPEVYRLKAELLMRGKTARPKEIEATFRKSIALAQKHQAKSCELRATISLSQFLVDKGNADQAISELRAVRSWFTEGFETLDLQCADQLLATWDSAAALERTPENVN